MPARFHNELTLMAQRSRTAQDWLKPSDLGRYRKRKPLDCGNPRCGMCHSDKLAPINRGAVKRAAISDSLGHA